MQLLQTVNRIAHGTNLQTLVFLHDHSFSLKLLLNCSFVQVKDGLCCGHLIADLLVDGAKRFARMHQQVGVGHFHVYSFCLCVLKVWLMLSKMLACAG